MGLILMPDSAPQQLLHLVIGGELTDLEHTTFKDLDQVEIVGVFPNYATAHDFDRANLPLHAIGGGTDASLPERGHIGTDADARLDSQKRVAEWLAR